MYAVTRYDYFTTGSHKNQGDDSIATPKKLPSGSWRVRVYDYTDADGKPHYRSVTAPTKKEAARLAAEYADQRDAKRVDRDLTVGGMIDLYISSKESVLSQSTLFGYRKIQSERFPPPFGNFRVSRLTSQDVQLWVSEMSTRVSPKTVRNAYSLFSAALKVFAPDLHIRVTLPQPVKPDLYMPTDEDVRKLLECIADPQLELAVLLAALGPMRRGEICALEKSDVDGNVVTVRRNLVKGPDHRWTTKQPKTYSGYRQIVYPDFVIAKLNSVSRTNNLQPRIMSISPDQVTCRFDRVVRANGLPPFRFHDLRHYAASIMHALGMPDQYIMARGGWSSPSVMKSIYVGTMADKAKEFDVTVLEHFNNAFFTDHDTEYDTEP